MIATDQADNFMPPEGGAVFCLTSNTVSTVWDLGTIAFGTPINEKNVSNAAFYVTLQADGADVVYYYSSNGSLAISATANTAAAPTVVYTANVGLKLKDGTEQSRRIVRKRHRYLYIITPSGTGYVRGYVSSQRSDGTPNAS